ncbi:MAG: SDR family oxidoreductase [Pirellulales bacterium]
MHRLVFGCGYLGSRVARLWADQGDSVTAVTRSPERAQIFASHGWQPIVADISNEPELLTALSGLESIDTVLFAVGYDRTSGRSIHDIYVEGLRHVLRALTAYTHSIRTFLYISSTGVYGQTEGEWVDESFACQPNREGGIACLAAERLLQASCFGNRGIILRCAGLYGPGRLPYLRQIAAGEPIAVPAEGYLNLIHIDDAASITVQAAQQVAPPALFNVSDGQPVLRKNYYATLATLLNAPPPNFLPHDAPQPAASTASKEQAGSARRAARGSADKRVANARLQQLLAPTLLYPNHSLGLAQVVALSQTSEKTP